MNGPFIRTLIRRMAPPANQMAAAAYVIVKKFQGSAGFKRVYKSLSIRDDAVLALGRELLDALSDELLDFA